MKARMMCLLACAALLVGCAGGEGSSTTQGQDAASRRASTAPTQRDLDRLAASLQVKVAVVQNPNPASQCPPTAPWGLCVDATISLTNAGPAFAAPSGWSIYLSAIRKVLTLGNPEFAFTHVNGDLTRLDPTASFQGFAAGETKVLPVQLEYWIIAETDVMPRWYLAGPGLRPAVIASTDTEDVTRYVAPLATPLQQLRTSGDATVIATATTRFAANAGTQDPGAAAVAARIVPSPATLVLGTGELDVTRGLSLRASGLGADSLAAATLRLWQLGYAVHPRGVPVSVSVDPGDAAFAGKPTAEAYRLSVRGHGVVVVGGDA